MLSWYLDKVPMSDTYLLIEDIACTFEGLGELKYWKRRLARNRVPFIVASRRVEGKLHYSIFSKKEIFS